MKSFITLFVFFCFSVLQAQTKRPEQPINLATYAPINPVAGDIYAPNIGHSYEGVDYIMEIHTSGQGSKVSHYNPKGYIQSMRASYDEYHYEYNSDLSVVTVSSKTRKLKYIYDKSMNLIEATEADRNGHVSNQTIYTYDVNNQLIRIERLKNVQVKKGLEGGAIYRLKTQSIVHYEYDTLDRVSKEKAANDTYDYTYNQQGQELLIRTSKDGNPISEYTYNQDGLLTKHEMFIYGGKETLYKKEYDSNGFLLLSEEIDKDKNHTKTAYVVRYNNGATSYPQTTQVVFVDPKKTSEVYTIASTDFESQQGFFENKKLNGPGNITRFGTLYKGNFKNGNLDLFGLQFSFADNVAAFGSFKDGILDGYGIKMVADKVVEAGIYKNGKLQQNLAEAYLNKQSKYPCEGDCQNGFGILKNSSNNSVLYSFFENGNATGPYYLLVNGKMAEVGIKTPEYTFIEGQREGKLYFGFIDYFKNKPFKVFVKSTTEQAACIYKNKQLVKTIEVIAQ